MTLHIETPRIKSRPLGKAAGRLIELKLESLQPSGSFKMRGIGHACEVHAARGARRFLSSSGGNAGIAVAHAGRRLGVPVVVVVPESTTERARRTIEAEDAELIVHDASWQDAHALAVSMRGDQDALIHPFDDPLISTGHASLIDEAARQGETRRDRAVGRWRWPAVRGDRRLATQRVGRRADRRGGDRLDDERNLQVAAATGR